MIEVYNNVQFNDEFYRYQSFSLLEMKLLFSFSMNKDEFQDE